ncbi:transcription-repair coupling factor [Brachyspira hampsonii 30446]|uniref:Transcription-repair-coupling factor n=2 Tax=Brachyspira hampsonii TaxID=1287055 RepID=A0A2U4EVW4_9SPIR|nr:transcription-repair coupling factor [Brachyspira hampsonii]EKV57066.1 transcription-repair coupling factor [Brachyspira hampsonii 30446]OEJ19281.1 transcription-repair coupling factor [Brachyspira hampsonii]
MHNNESIYRELIEKFSKSEEFVNFDIKKTKSITGLKGGSDSLFFASIFNTESILIIKENESDAMLLSQSLNFYNIPNYYFPDYDTVPFTKMSPITDIAQERINILYKLINKEKCIIITTINAVTRKLPNRNDLKNLPIYLNVGDKLDLDNLRLTLYDLGYVIEREVAEKGTASVRGSIVDIFSVEYDNPIRIELFDDEIESIRLFNIEDGRSFKTAENIIIYPVREAVYSDTAVNEFLNNNNINDEIRDNIIKRKYFAGSENLLPIFYNDLETIFDYFDYGYIFIDDALKLKNKFITIIDTIKENFNDIDNIFNIIEDIYKLYIDNNYFSEIIKKSINISPFITDTDIYKFNFLEGISFKSRLTDFLDYVKEYREKDYLIILSTGHNDQALRFYKIMQDLSPIIITENEIEYEEKVSEYKENNDNKEIINNSIENTENNNEDNKEIILEDANKDKEIKKDYSKNENNFYIITTQASSGFIKDDIKTIFIADWEVFGRKRKKVRKIPKVNKNLIETFVDLNVGDYAVHVNYGIGKYLGLTRKMSNGKEKDYITLEYAKGDKLYIPVEQMNFVQKYISGHGEAPKLTLLGGSAWDKIKSKAREDALATARELIKLYAIRSNIRGNVYGADTQWQDDFEASFRYEETVDQLRAINDIKEDMESGKMMDRLVCGDVGFGKTEVAFRAVFKAIMAGKQCAILCPTTILSQQHYNNAKKRFEDFPIRIEVLNRFVTSRQAKRNKELLKTGSCDLIVGTHMLLSKDIEFKNLGLIVIDEEQRFGVKHKEALKKLRLETDVLTLSATPIPRTLNMALTGIRDISIIETPPLNRIPVKTFVTEFSEEAVVNAIERELKREGQVFYLYNRIDTIESFALMIKKLCPKARICVAHGRMTGHQLEKIMEDFINHKYDILVSTTIIENGIDIPNANTILIDNANKLGLSELYQLRGRVGRSDREAYAYMFYPSDLALTEVAYKRLEAISEHTDLGAGFKIAMRDLEIRGAGNILGKEQSGMIYQVGYELYTQMLEEAANEYKGEIKEVTFDTVIDLKHNLFIPDSYIADSKEKISAYKLIMRSQSDEDIEYSKEFMTDKYGKLPRELEDIFNIAKLKIILKRIRILSVIEGQYNIYLKLDKLSKIDTDKLVKLINTKNSGVYFDKDNLNQLIIPVVNEKENDIEWKLEKIKNVILEIESENYTENSNSQNESNKNNENKIDNKKEEHSKMSIAEANLKNNKNNKKRTISRRSPKLIKVNKK